MIFIIYNYNLKFSHLHIEVPFLSIKKAINSYLATGTALAANLEFISLCGDIAFVTDLAGRRLVWEFERGSQ